MGASKNEKKRKNDTSGSGGDPPVLGPTYESGKPDAPMRWRDKMRSRKEMLNYLQTAERYWFGKGYGSEKRKTDA